jgi:uncharacterized membrane protein YphA (DoxX/SURF4 family)
VSKGDGSGSVLVRRVNMTGEDWISRKAPRWYVVLFRLFMGYYFLYVGLHRVLDLWVDNDALTRRFAALAEPGTQIFWFRPYLDAVMEPIKGTMLFTMLLTAAPLLLGLSLLIGLFTRVSTLLGVLMLLNIYLIKFHGMDESQLLFYQTQTVSLVVLFFAGAGRTFGIDGVFWRNRMRLKYGSETPRGVKAAGTMPSRASREPGPIPLSGAGPRRIEDTLGHFSTQLGHEGKPESSAGATPEEKR